MTPCNSCRLDAWIAKGKGGGIILVKLTGVKKRKARWKASKIPWADFSSGEECWRGPSSPTELLSLQQLQVDPDQH